MDGGSAIAKATSGRDDALCPRRPTLVLADDYPSIRWLLTRALGTEFEILGSVGDGRALVDIALTFRPDVIVTDWTMPEMTGLEATRHLRPLLPTTTIIVLSNHDDPRYAAEALANGAAAYLVKHDIEDVVSVVSAIVRGRSAAA